MLDEPACGLAAQFAIVAAERVRAGPAGIPAVRASGAVANAEEVSECQLHQGAEAVRAGHGVFGQHGTPIVAGIQGFRGSRV